ncbi:MAG: dienelactone hydrolase family protein [Gemmatimonadaceae bacterium]|jgi:dienelactone hydrolase|nr:dienelactone hydrolase family protein [Gemmatimonadaceae bacterium]
MSYSSLLLAVFALSWSSTCGAWQPARTANSSPRLAVPDSGWIITGDPVAVRILDVAPRDTVTLIARRWVLLSRWSGDGWTTDTVAVQSRARWVGRATGSIAIDRDAPIDGTWRESSPWGVLWSMRRDSQPDAASRTRSRSRIALTLLRGSRVVDTATLRLRSSAVPLDTTVVLRDGVAGAFVRPSGARRVPTVIALHGSEGGDTVTNKAMATMFAARGYATLALSYYNNQAPGALPGVPVAFDSLPIGLLDRARDWLGARPEADTSRTALWGASKGGEFVMVAAARRRWPRAVVGCVPSDVMWAGYGRAPAPGEVLTSWSDGDRRLPAIPYDRYEEVFQDKGITPRTVHDRSRAGAPDAARAARIPIEQTRAPLLLLGGDRDDVWASGPMVASIDSTMRASGNRVDVETARYADAGHAICSRGIDPVPDYGADDDPVAIATARAAADAWRRTVAFLARTLGPRAR